MPHFTAVTVFIFSLLQYLTTAFKNQV